MNIKNIRKNYDSLTMLERLALADNAESRDDESELRAINDASPKEHFRQVDFYDLMKEITKFRLINLIVRLGYIMQFDYFCLNAELDILKNKSSFKGNEQVWTDLKMSAFLYVRATDSWKTVNDELGLRPDFEGEISKFLFSVEMMKEKETIMRKIAFTEDEARKHIKKVTGDDKIQTLADEVKAIKEALEIP